MAKEGEIMARKKRVKKCACCGQTFEIQPHEHDDKQFCDKACFYASRTGMSRTEWLFEHGQYMRRKCHDCGKPTNDYRCPECWRKIRNTPCGDDMSPDDYYGVREGAVWVD